ncbi:Swr1p like SWI SNF3 family ATpase with a HSA domain at the N-terminus [Cryptosporidium sp. chipmunk genotype I]|uniref:Swr1p like SWI SNF3 family ATpase with a HSA domain at the N-terminus n=1 Tax=Cryptosporidium sp. chipmunk genotype I TaxID=1280935 RepID=UPI00351A5FC4|nr:Swr1p like SWI SNF3 family ATpase with a HSA domain at the N-terminus [Cryptosporidium sp. chipmunk genotype I]
MKSKSRFQKSQLLIEIEPPKELDEDHRDFLIKESRWMYGCFTDEHKWKIKSFKAVAQCAVRYLQTKDQRLKKRKEEEDKRLKLISKNISASINKFWNNVSKIVRHKKLSELNKLLRIKQFEKLDKLVSETEKFYFGITDELGSKKITKPNDQHGKVEINGISDSEDDVDTNNWDHIEEADNKLDLEMESSDFDSDELDAELDELNNDANLNLEDLYLKYYGNICNKKIKLKRDKSDTATIGDGTKRKKHDYYEYNDGSTRNYDEEEFDTEKDVSYADKDYLSWKDECDTLKNDENTPIGQAVANLKEKSTSPSIVKTFSIPPRASIDQIKIPFLLKNSMREYQIAGLEWMVKLYKRGLNGILADEMGLGKTIQTISLLAYLACYMKNWGPHLIVVPTSVMLNWEMEFKRWLPSFKVVTYFGNPKERQKKRMGWNDPNAFNVCIASYTLILQDAHIFKRKQWQYLILDEAQNIKNFKSQKWQVMLSFNTERRLLLTGTPLQNNLMELWSLLHFLMPHIFTSHHDFKTWFSDPLTTAIENQQVENERNLLRRLHSVLRPFLLRRLKKDVEKEMPSKIEHVIKCPLSKRQKELYDEFLESKTTQNTIAGGDYIGLMNVLMQLRKVCNHPDLFEPRLIKTPIVEKKLMINYSFNSLTFFPNVCTTMSSNVPTLGKNVSTNNYLFVGKKKNNSKSTLFEKLTNNRFVNLPNIFILYNEIHMSKFQAQSQRELTYEKWTEIQPFDYISENSLFSKCIMGSGNLLDADRFIRINLNKLASIDINPPLIGVDSHCSLYTKNVDNKYIMDHISNNRVKNKSNTNMNSTESVSILCKEADKKITFEWRPSCDYPHLLDESIQAFHSNTTKNTNCEGKTYTKFNMPFNVVYGKDCRSFILNEMQNYSKVVNVETISFSTFPNLFPNKKKYCKNAISRLHKSAYYNIPNKKNTNLINSEIFPNELLFFRPYFCKQLPMLSQFSILLEKKVISTNFSISIEGKYSVIKNELFCNSYISLKVDNLINSSNAYLHNVSFLKKCIVPPRRVIEDDCGKFQILSQLLHKLFNEGHRCIIFTQMSKMLDVLESFINYRGYNYLRLDGNTKVDDRQKLVNRFNRDQRIYLFISSTRSGGVGLNLTGADTVIFYDSDWNPAMDRQAMDRCHRIGQTRDVNIYRLISEWTIEESIFKKQLQKRLLDDVVVDQGNFTSEFFTKNDIQKMIGSRSQNMLNSENNSIYVTRVLHESSTSELNVSVNFDDNQKKEFEEVLAAVEDLDDINALKKSSREIATENDDFINEFGEEKTKDKHEVNKTLEKDANRHSTQNGATPDITLNNLLKYCIEFFENVSVPLDIQNEVDLMEFQINNIDSHSSVENSLSENSQNELPCD